MRIWGQQWRGGRCGWRVPGRSKAIGNRVFKHPSRVDANRLGDEVDPDQLVVNKELSLSLLAKQSHTCLTNLRER